MAFIRFDGKKCLFRVERKRFGSETNCVSAEESSVGLSQGTTQQTFPQFTDFQASLFSIFPRVSIAFVESANRISFFSSELLLNYYVINRDLSRQFARREEKKSLKCVKNMIICCQMCNGSIFEPFFFGSFPSSFCIHLVGGV